MSGNDWFSLVFACIIGAVLLGCLVVVAWSWIRLTVKR